MAQQVQRLLVAAVLVGAVLKVMLQPTLMEVLQLLDKATMVARVVEIMVRRLAEEARVVLVEHPAMVWLALAV
jgi:hypothetical protein